MFAPLPPGVVAEPLAAGWTALDLACWAWIAAVAMTYVPALRSGLRAAAAYEGLGALLRTAHPRASNLMRILEEI